MWTDESASALGLLCEVVGGRPSDMVEWSDSNDVFGRLFFDMFIISKIKRDK